MSLADGILTVIGFVALGFVLWIAGTVYTLRVAEKREEPKRRENERQRQRLEQSEAEINLLRERVQWLEERMAGQNSLSPDDPHGDQDDN